MEVLLILEIFISILIFSVLFIVGKYIYKRLNNNKNRVLNPLEYFPEEEFQTLKQVFYLIMMLIFFVFIIYILIVKKTDFIGIAFLQIIVSLYVTLTLDYNSWKNKILFFLLIPYEAMGFLVFNESSIFLPIYIVHIIIYAYFMKIYFDKFWKYTETNSLGITIILLFSIIFISFITTSIVESVDPLNSMVMVSNAFTSNGYAILGKSSVGKLNALVLVWGGYVISGVGTATLTVAILSRHNHKHEKALNKRLDELESLIKNNQK